MNNILVDSCFWFALFDKSDEHYHKAQEIARFLEHGNLIIPYPSLYEALNTRFVKRKDWNIVFNDYLSRNSTRLIHDENYRQKALDSTFYNSTNSKRPMSLVDMTIRFMLEDVNLNVNALITFNVGDFIDICAIKRIEIIP
jgi:predicted nucleic acid-binding protein